VQAGDHAVVQQRVVRDAVGHDGDDLRPARRVEDVRLGLRQTGDALDAAIGRHYRPARRVVDVGRQRVDAGRRVQDDEIERAAIDQGMQQAGYDRQRAAH